MASYQRSIAVVIICPVITPYYTLQPLKASAASKHHTRHLLNLLVEYISHLLIHYLLHTSIISRNRCQPHLLSPGKRTRLLVHLMFVSFSERNTTPKLQSEKNPSSPFMRNFPGLLQRSIGHLFTLPYIPRLVVPSQFYCVKVVPEV